MLVNNFLSYKFASVQSFEGHVISTLNILGIIILENFKQAAKGSKRAKSFEYAPEQILRKIASISQHRK